jgi:hypothetical protein
MSTYQADLKSLHPPHQAAVAHAALVEAVDALIEGLSTAIELFEQPAVWEDQDQVRRLEEAMDQLGNTKRACRVLEALVASVDELQCPWLLEAEFRP